MSIHVLETKEHSFIDAGNVDVREFPTAGEARGNCQLGVFVEGRPLRLKTNYFVGMTWLEPGKTALRVVPKIDGLDWLSMFRLCMASPDRDVQAKLPEIFGVEENMPPIPTSNQDTEPIRAFWVCLLSHLLKPILAKGFKSNFVQRSDNLTGKMKGTVSFNQHLRRNILTGHEERVYCRYQEYDIDCLENQVLKRAIRIAMNFAPDSCDESAKILRQAYRRLSAVSELKSVGQMRQMNINSIYMDYKRVLQVSKAIILSRGNDIERTDEKGRSLFMPYWINMPLLFELYTLARLREIYGETIRYHIRTYGNETDFAKTDENLIIDAKYIPDWAGHINHENIRQLSGYARHVRIREQIIGDRSDETTILPIAIVYPTAEAGHNFLSDQEMLTEGNRIALYVKAYKFAIHVPIKASGRKATEQAL